MKLFLSTILSAVFLFCGNAYAIDELQMHSINSAMTAPGVRDQFDPSVRFYFGRGLHPKILREFGDWRANKKKVSAFNKPSKEICNSVFLAALLELQERAKRAGGNAVIDIKSNYKNIERSSESQFVCGNSASMVSVALKGTIVKLEADPLKLPR